MASTRSTERLVLTMPPDPHLSRLARLAVLHFLRHNGAGAGVARSGARAVQQRCEAWMRSVAARRGRGSMSLILTSGPRRVEVTGVIGPGRVRRSLFRFQRPQHP